MKVIGIDPGVKTGMAVYEGGRLVTVETSSFWKVYNGILGYKPEDVVIVIEDASLNSGLYVRHKLRAAGAEYRDRFAISAGSVRRESELLVEGLRLQGYRVIAVKPSSRSHKWTDRELQRFTGYTGRTSEHGRDAARMAFPYAENNLIFRSESNETIFKSAEIEGKKTRNRRQRRTAKATDGDSESGKPQRGGPDIPRLPRRLS